MKYSTATNLGMHITSSDGMVCVSESGQREWSIECRFLQHSVYCWIAHSFYIARVKTSHVLRPAYWCLRARVLECYIWHEKIVIQEFRSRSRALWRWSCKCHSRTVVSKDWRTDITQVRALRSHFQSYTAKGLEKLMLSAFSCLEMLSKTPLVKIILRVVVCRFAFMSILSDVGDSSLASYPWCLTVIWIID
jgi:hypothetical protein